MTDVIQLMRSNTMTSVKNISAESVKHQPEVGDILEGEVVEKVPELTSVILDERIVKLSGDVEIVEEVGEKLRLEVTKITDEIIELKYMEPNRPSTIERSISGERHRSFEVPKEYNKDLIKAVKTMDPKEVKAIEAMVTRLEDNLTILVDTMTNEDVKSILEEGLNPQKLSIEMMTQIVKHNKTGMKTYDLKAIEVDVTKELKQLEDHYKVDQRLEDIIKTLKVKNLPITKKNVDKLIETTSKVDKVVSKAENKWVNILKVEEPITIEKLYKAVSMPIVKDKELQMSVADEKDLVVKHLKSLDMEASTKEVEVALRMIKQDIPITKVNVDFAVKPLQAFADIEEIVLIDKMVDQIVKGTPIEQVQVPLFDNEIEVEREVKAEIKREVKAEIKREVKAEVRSTSEPGVDVSWKAKSSEISIEESRSEHPQELIEKIAAITHNQIIRASYESSVVSLRDIFTSVDEPLDLREKEPIDLRGKEPIDLREKEQMDLREREVLDLTEKDEINEELISKNRDLPKEMIKRHRQVEEIRLKMTIEAVTKLKIKGLKIETQPLEKVVDALRLVENELFEKQMVREYKGVDHKVLIEEQEPLEAKSAIAIAMKTMQKIDVVDIISQSVDGYKILKSLPEGKIAQLITLDRNSEVKEVQVEPSKLARADVNKSEGDNLVLEKPENKVLAEDKVTIDKLIQMASESKSNEFIKSMPQVLREQVANQAYEKSETKIRRDLGDKIEKTFSQIEPMLKSLGIEPSKEAVKAAQILARNEMPISEESILEIQLVQEKVDYVTTRMNPRLVLEMINVGVTPLDLSIDETIEIIEQYDHKFGETETEKISRLIHSLEKDGLMSDEQKESLMGIYRTFDTVVRSKGAATGFLVKNQRPLNVDQLFEAAKFIRKTGQIRPAISADIDDQFGTLSSIEKSRVGIKDQVLTAIDAMGIRASREVVETARVLEEQEVEIGHAKVLSKLLMDMTIKSFISEVTNKALLSVEEDTNSKSDNDIREIPLKELESLMKAVNVPNKDDEIESNMNRTKVEAIMQFTKTNSELVKQMVKSDIPLTPENIEKAIEMNHEPFNLLTKLRHMIESVDDPIKRSKIIQEIEVTSREILSGEKSMSHLKDMLENLEKDLLMETSNQAGTLVSENVDSAIKSVNHTQMIQMTEDYYQIPVMMDGELSQLNLYVLNDEGTHIGTPGSQMKVIMRFNTHNLGDVTAFMEFEGNAMSLNMQASQGDADTLSACEAQIRALVLETNFSLSEVAYKDLYLESPVEKIDVGSGVSSSDLLSEEARSASGFEVII